MKAALRLSAPLAVVPTLVLLLVSAPGSSVRVEPMDSVGPRALEAQTRTSVIRDYLAAWQALSAATSQNSADLLDACFVGQAKEKLAETIEKQQALKIRTTYQDTAHDIRVVFYSPEGLSIQLVDDVEYTVYVRKDNQLVGTTPVQTRYVAVLTPTESKWKVRVFQGGIS